MKRFLKTYANEGPHWFAITSVVLLFVLLAFLCPVFSFPFLLFFVFSCIPRKHLWCDEWIATVMTLCATVIYRFCVASARKENCNSCSAWLRASTKRRAGEVGPPLSGLQRRWRCKPPTPQRPKICRRASHFLISIARNMARRRAVAASLLFRPMAHLTYLLVDDKAR